MEKVICNVCGNEIEYENMETVTCQFCDHIQKMKYDEQSLENMMELISSILGNSTYMTNPEIVSRILNVAKKTGNELVAERCQKIIELLPEQNEKEVDALVMKMAHLIDENNSDWQQLFDGDKKVSVAVEALCQSRLKIVNRASFVQDEINKTEANVLDIFRSKKVDELRKQLRDIESELKECDDKKDMVSQNWGKLYTDKIIEIATNETNIKYIRNRIKCLEVSKFVSGSSLEIDDYHYLNLFALSNNLMGLVKGSLVSFGKYKGEPVIWKVLAINDERILVITENIIEVGPYHMGTYVTEGYEGSNIRKWMNEQLIFDLFNQFELKFVDLIGEDRIFLLEASQAEFMFNSNSDRQALPTAYSIAKGVEYQVSGKKLTGPYWLKSINEYTMNKIAYTVEANGEISKGDGLVNNNRYGIRPALWLSIKK